jgi:hypothetical protein
VSEDERPKGEAAADDEEGQLGWASDEEPTLAEEAGALAESAAEFGVGAVIAPFAGGQTVDMVESLVTMVEAGVDRLTHLGDHAASPDEPDDPESDTIRRDIPLDDQASDGRE